MRRTVRNQRQIVDYGLQRLAVLRRYRAGFLTREDVCAGGPYLRQAARFHGQPAEHDCPVCGKSQLALVAWVYGDALGLASGSARKSAGLERMTKIVDEFSSS